MWLPAITTSPPAEEPISATLATAQLRGIAADDGPLLDILIGVARAHVEAYTGLRLVRQTVELCCSSFEDLERFDTGPISSISEISYIDTAGVRQTLDAGDYEFFSRGLVAGVHPAFQAVFPATRRIEDAVLVTAMAGYATSADVPKPIVQAMLLLIGDWYQNREDTIAERSVTPATMPNGVQSLLANWRLF